MEIQTKSHCIIIHKFAGSADLATFLIKQNFNSHEAHTSIFLARMLDRAKVSTTLLALSTLA